MATVWEALELGWREQQSGRLEAAERIYRLVLADWPECATAWHRLGSIAQQLGRGDLAVEYLSQAVSLSPDDAEAYGDLGIALQRQGILDEAVVSLQRALELKPDAALVHFNLGNALELRGKVEEAAAAYQRAVALAPDFWEAHYNLAAAQQRARRLDESAQAYRRAIELNPLLAEAHNNLGNVLQQQGQLSDATASFARAVELRPGDPSFHNNLGNGFTMRGMTEEAIASFRRALALKPDYAEAYTNLGTLLQTEGKVDDALDCYRQALSSQPGYAPAHNNIGTALEQVGKLTEAFDCYSRATELEPDNALAHRNRAMLLLLRGDFRQGWSEFEWRWKTDQPRARNFHQPPWEGEPVAGRTILLHAEQGLGDTLQFIRYVPLVKALTRGPASKGEGGGAVIVECQKALCRLLSRCGGIDRLVARGDELPEFDVHAPLLSLPRTFGTTLENIPAAVPYLFADPALVEQWRQRLDAIRGEGSGNRDRGTGNRGHGSVPVIVTDPLTQQPATHHSPPLLIGINWCGRQNMPGARKRDVPVEFFAELAQVPGVRLISLQKDTEGRDRLTGRDALAGTADATIIDFGDELDAAHGAFMDTAAIMMNLDLVISSDTSIPHLAGALGVPVWVALPFVPDWRWLLERTDTPWYPTMRLFRQPSRGDWAGAFRQIEAALRERLRTARATQ
jgi:tetratricopeptide (TPR) repeat protein